MLRPRLAAEHPEKRQEGQVEAAEVLWVVLVEEVYAHDGDCAGGGASGRLVIFSGAVVAILLAACNARLRLRGQLVTIWGTGLGPSMDG
jgi:hypothetical protein